ncbi:YggT family protein [Paenibacillus sp. PsM32]|uniref:YggT family protein n=1 Tax=Paenibacillus kyungheensis TaxID=1452732 RepID=A0AAX3LY85_9BACL|nr:MULTISPECIES: YggT family protein [Paenibacillus]MDN4620553.1 YggT family protein [Paenibacillus sp. PsM32]MDQ1234996.1 YggT family protein [Paenibacillus sp. SORGH_AS_0306]MDR6112044.1 YggT family protein [Paenibacillus sp. SORGH_AS_0338]WCT54570.1 YggT family protein [Paenibacillus kyungheensis]
METAFAVLNALYRIYTYMIIIYILLSWLPSARESSFGQILARLVEPYLAPFRRFIPPIMGAIDISPIVALFVLQLAFSGLVFLLRSLIY